MVKHVYDNYQELKVGRNHVKGWISVFFSPTKSWKAQHHWAWIPGSSAAGERLALLSGCPSQLEGWQARSG